MTIAEILFLAAMLAYFLIVTPLLAHREMAGLRRAIAAGMTGLRLRAYNGTIVLQWSVTAVALGWWLLLGRSTHEIGLHIEVAGWQWLAIAVCLVALAVVAVHSLRSIGRPDELAKMRDQLGDLVLMVPHTRRELHRFGWLSITAGICEEILYRGLLMTALTGLFGLWPAVVVSSVVFGVGHSYQGLAGIARTGAVGLVLALVVVFTGSLPVAILMHAVIDLVQGRMVWAAVTTGPETPGSRTVPAPAIS